MDQEMMAMRASSKIFFHAMMICLTSILVLRAGAAEADAPGGPILAIDAGGHTGEVFKLMFTPDGKQLVSVSADKTIRFWDVTSGKPLRVLRPPVNAGLEGSLAAAALSPDGRMLAVAGVGSRLKVNPIDIIDFETGRIRRVLRGHTGTIRRLNFAPDGRRLVSGSSDHTARVWDVESGKCEQVLVSHTSTVIDVAFSPDGQRVATASEDATARIWGVAMLRGHSQPLTSLAWQPDGSALITGGLDGSIRLWNSRGDLIRDLGGVEGQVTSLAVGNDGGSLLYTWSAGKRTRFGAAILDLATGREKSLFDRHRIKVGAGALSPDGATAATADLGGDVYLWRTVDGEPIHTLFAQGDAAYSAGWRPDGRAIAWGNTDRGPYFNPTAPLEHAFSLVALGMADAPDGTYRRAQLEGGPLALSVSGPSTVAVKRDGSSISPLNLPGDKIAVFCGTLLQRDRVALGGGLFLYLFDATNGTLIGHFQGHTGLVTAVTPSPDGRYMLSACRDRILRFWDIAAVEAALASNTRAGTGVGADLDGEFYKVRRITPGLPLARDGRIKLGDTIMAVAQGGGAFVELRNKPYADVSGMISGAPGTMVRFRVSRDGVDGTFECEFTRERLPAAFEPALSLFVAEDDWIAWTPEGYYAASPGGERLVGWQVGNGPDAMSSYYPAAQFRKTLYRPDVIRRRLESGSLAKALADADTAVGQQSRRTEVAQVLPPWVAITSPATSKVKLDGKKIKIDATARSIGENPIIEMRVLLDGRPMPEAVKTIRSIVLGEVHATWTVEVPPGGRSLTVQASSAVSKGLSDPVEVVGAGDDGKAAGKLYLLVVGINDYLYLGKRNNLDSAVPDARSIHKSFRDLSRPLFRSVESRLLLDKQATRANILDSLQWLKQSARPGDKAVVFYAGHGDNQATGQFYLLPVDTKLDDLRGTGISDDELKRSIGDLPCTTVLMLDACYSGGFGEKKRKTRGLSKPSDALAGDMVNDYGLATLCGARDNQTAIEEGGHGFFTLALTQGLAGEADTDKDGLVELYELLPFVCSKVRKLSAGDQVPTFGLPQSIESFPMSKP